MKFLYFALLSVLSLAVHVNGSEFYVGGWRNLTCKGHADGHISCEQGHKEGVPEIALPEHDTRDLTTIRGAERSEVTAVPVPGLEKRLTCNLDAVPATRGLSCFSHCFLIGYCNSHCDSNNICHCTCMDKTAWWNPIVCSKTSCA